MRIKFTRLNYESSCFIDCLNNKGYIINEPPFSDIDKQIKNVDGPRSPRYGYAPEDASEFNNRYRCKCGKYVGAVFEGEECPECHTKIEYHDVDILYTGWLNFAPYKVINPLWYKKLESALSKDNLKNIISNENIITSSGIIRKYNDDIEVKKSMLKYHNIGMYEFYLNYEEIMLYFKQKRKAKADLIQQLIDKKNYVWTSKIPVYSTVFRPFTVGTESLYFSPIDRNVFPLTNISINLKRASPIEVPLYLFQAQEKINELWEINFGLLDGKHGIIRSTVLGGEFNFSATQNIA